VAPTTERNCCRCRLLLQVERIWYQARCTISARAPALACWRAKSGRLARHLSVSSAHIFQPWLQVLLHPHHHGFIISHNNRRTSSLQSPSMPYQYCRFYTTAYGPIAAASIGALLEEQHRPVCLYHRHGTTRQIENDPYRRCTQPQI
jgi:hypothetical protein